ncbi:hypothetical protein ACFL0H_04815 [Thermodesulfobacteriota bacterium]
MEIDKAIMAFSQSEKVKSGIIWATQTLNIIQGLPAGEKTGGEKVINALINMIGQEIRLAETVSGDEGWCGIEPYIEKAVLMINSGVSQEATIHLSRALSMVTNIGQQSMTVLKEENLI